MRDELNPANDLTRQTAVVRNEQFDPCLRSASQVNGIGRRHGKTTANLCEYLPRCRPEIEESKIRRVEELSVFSRRPPSRSPLRICASEAHYTPAASGLFIPSHVSTFPARDFESCLIISSRELHMVAPYMLPDLMFPRIATDRIQKILLAVRLIARLHWECLGPGDHCCGGPGAGYRSVGRVLLAGAAGRGH
jgi:hypothetical protein